MSKIIEELQNKIKAEFSELAKAVLATANVHAELDGHKGAFKGNNDYVSTHTVDGDDHPDYLHYAILIPPQSFLDEGAADKTTDKWSRNRAREETVGGIYNLKEAFPSYSRDLLHLKGWNLGGDGVPDYDGDIGIGVSLKNSDKSIRTIRNVCVDALSQLPASWFADYLGEKSVFKFETETLQRALVKKSRDAKDAGRVEEYEEAQSLVGEFAELAIEESKSAGIEKS